MSLEERQGGSLFSQFPCKIQELEITCEKHFRVSHKKSHKVEVLARIYFSITGQSREMWGKRENHSLLPLQEIEEKTQNGGFYM
jgi:hypothetical protein